MKTYKDLMTEALTPKGVAESALDAAEDKLDRDEVLNALLNIEVTYRKIVEYATSDDYMPPPGNPQILTETVNKKVRYIDKPRYFPEQILHHVLIRNFRKVLRDGLYEQAYGCLPQSSVRINKDKYQVRKYGPHAAAKKLAKWAQNGKKTYVYELDVKQAYGSVHIPTLGGMLEKVIKDSQWINLAYKFLAPIHPGRKGLALGHYTSPWFFNFYLKDFDHVVAAIPEIKYLRFADNVFILGSSKRKVRAAGATAEKFLNKELHMEFNNTRQLYRFEYYCPRRKEVRGRPIDALGAVVHHDRITLRKNTLYRMRKKANKIAYKKRNKKDITWHDSCSMVARLGPVKHTRIKKYVNGHVLNKINMKELKRKIRQHSKIKQKINKERREMVQDAIQRFL